MDIRPKDCKQKKKIILNAAIEVKTDHNVACTVYDSTDEIFGKKDEFRWVITKKLGINFFL